jgi:hypothetical protein
MKQTRNRLFIAGLFSLAWGFTGPAAEPIAPEQFAKLHALIKPEPGEEKWDQIPWLTNLWEARQRAAAQGKPILLWEMDGHPLGCT